jgi:hypothetical protein
MATATSLNGVDLLREGTGNRPEHMSRMILARLLFLVTDPPMGISWLKHYITVICSPGSCEGQVIAASPLPTCSPRQSIYREKWIVEMDETKSHFVRVPIDETI